MVGNVRKKSDLPLLRCAYAVYDDDFYLAPFPYSRKEDVRYMEKFIASKILF
jgi:hypothetical protein